MRKLILVFLIALIAEDVCSQGDHFIYIQSDNQKPYYLRFGSKMLRSSGEGYLVIQGLSSNNYEFFIGFPDAAPGVEWRFDCALGEKDLGFTLKNSGASPQLINLGQKDGLTGTKVQVKEEKKIATQPVQLTGIVSDDAFSKMLADVVNDPTIRQQPVIIEKKVEPVLVAGIPGKDSAGIAKGKADSLASSTALATAAAKVPSVPAKDSIKAVASAVLTTKETVTKPDSGNAKAITQKQDSANLANTVAAKRGENKPFVVKETITKPDSGNSKAITQKQDSANLANTVAAKKGEDKPFVVKETITKPDSGNSKAITQKQDSANLVNTVASKKGEDKPFVVKETKGNNQPTPPTAASVKTDSSIVKVAKNANEPFVIKETVDNNGKLSVSKDSVGNASIAQAKESKPVVSSEKPKEEPFVVKELTKTENKAAKANDNPSDKKTLPFTVQPQGEIAVAKEAPKNDSKISKAVDSSVQKTTAVTTPPRSDAKEIPKADTKNPQSSITAGADKTTAAVTSPPKEDKSFVLKETIADKNNQADKIASPSAPNKNAITSSVSIKKTLQRKSIDGIELIYVDEGANGVKDTIRILIPAAK